MPARTRKRIAQGIVEMPSAEEGRTASLKMVVPQPEVPDLLKTYSLDFLECRVDRHRWSRKAFWSPIAANVSERIRQCEVCGTKVVQTINTRTWSRMGQVKYRYAPGYRQPRSGLTMSDYRVRHLSVDFSAAEKAGRIDV